MKSKKRFPLIFLSLSVFACVILFGIKFHTYYTSTDTVIGTVIESSPSFKKSTHKYEFEFKGKLYTTTIEPLFFMPREGSKDKIYLKVLNGKIEAITASPLNMAEIISLFALGFAWATFLLMNRRKMKEGLLFLSALCFLLSILSLGEKYFLLKDAEFLEGVITKEGTLDYSPEVQFSYNQINYTIPAKWKTRSKNSLEIELMAMVYNKQHNQVGHNKTVVFERKNPTDAVIYDLMHFWMKSLGSIFSFLFFLYMWINCEKWQKRKIARDQLEAEERQKVCIPTYNVMERPKEFKNNQEWAEDYIYRVEKILKEYKYSKDKESLLEQMKELWWKSENQEFITLSALKDLDHHTLKAIKVAENKIRATLELHDAEIT